MKTTKSFGEIQELMYNGTLANKQFPTVATIDYTTLSPVQHRLFKNVMVGLDMYTKEELYAMNSSKKAKIFKRHKLAQNMINLWKQEICNAMTNKFLLSLFPKSELIQELTSDKTTDPAYTNTLTFKQLGINKNMLINKLINEKFLPSNFATL